MTKKSMPRKVRVSPVEVVSGRATVSKEPPLISADSDTEIASETEAQTEAQTEAEEIARLGDKAQEMLQREHDAAVANPETRVLSDAAALAQETLALEQASKQFSQEERRGLAARIWLQFFDTKKRKRERSLQELIAVIREERRRLGSDGDAFFVPQVPEYTSTTFSTQIEQMGIAAGIKNTAVAVDSLTFGAAMFFLAQNLTGEVWRPFSSPQHAAAVAGALLAIPVFKHIHTEAFAQAEVDRPFLTEEQLKKQSMYRAALLAALIPMVYPSVVSTANTFLNSEQSSEFAGDAETAVEDIQRQFDELSGPTMEQFWGNLDRILDEFVVSERDGTAVEGRASSGVAGYGPITAGRDYLLYGSFEHYREGTDTLSGESRETAEIWARERRERLGLEEGESVKEQCEEYYAEYEQAAREEFARLAELLPQTLDIVHQLQSDSVPINTKLNLLIVYISNPGGLENIKNEALEVILRIQGLYRELFRDRVATLKDGLIDAMREQGAAGDIVIDTPNPDIDTTLFEQIEAPEMEPVFDPRGMMKIFTEGKPMSIAVFLAIIALMAGSVAAPSGAAKARGKRQKEMLGLVEGIAFGEESYLEGKEYQFAKAIGEAIQTLLNGAGWFGSEELRKTLPFGEGAWWLDLSPEFVMTSLRSHAEEKSGAIEKSGGNTPAGWLSSYIEMWQKMGERGPQAAPVEAYNTLAHLLGDNVDVAFALDETVLPGIGKIREIAELLEDEARKNENAGKPRSSGARMERLSREFIGAYMNLVFNHLLARVEHARTKIELYNNMFDDLRERGVLEHAELGVTGDIPNISVNLLGGDFKALLDNDDVLGEVGGTIARNTAVDVIERGLARERRVLKKIEQFLDALTKKTTERSIRGDASAEFHLKMNEVQKRLRAETTSLPKGTDDKTAPYTARAGLGRIIGNQLEAQVREILGEVEKDEEQEESLTERATSMREKLTAVQTLLASFEDVSLQGGGTRGASRYFRNSRGFDKYECVPALEKRTRSADGSPVDYYAVIFRIYEKGDRTRLIDQGEYPLRKEFSTKVSAEQTTKSIERWLNAKRNEFSMKAAFAEAKKRIRNSKETAVGSLPEVNVADASAADTIEELFLVVLPKRKKMTELTQISQAFERIENQFKAIVEEDGDREEENVSSLENKSKRIGYLFELAKGEQARLDALEAVTHTLTPPEEGAIEGARRIAPFQALLTRQKVQVSFSVREKGEGQFYVSFKPGGFFQGSAIERAPVALDELISVLEGSDEKNLKKNIKNLVGGGLS